MELFVVLLQVVCLLFSTCLGQHDLLRPGSLVGPGAIETYRGPQEHRSYGVVSEWPAGFFVGGSSISPLNGLYGQAGHDHSLPHLDSRTLGTILIYQ